MDSSNTNNHHAGCALVPDGASCAGGGRYFTVPHSCASIYGKDVLKIEVRPSRPHAGKLI